MVFSVIFLLVSTATLADVPDVNGVDLLSVSACIGESKTLHCKQPVNYKETIIRFYSTKKSSRRLRKKIGKYDFSRNGALTINNIQERDAGNYRISCNFNKRCWNNTGSRPCVIKVEIKKCEMKEILYGSAITMPCKTNRPNANITEIRWYRKIEKPKSSVLLATMDSITDEANKMYFGRLRVVQNALTIANTKTNDAGIYICKAEFVKIKNDFRMPRSSYTYHISVTDYSTNATMLNATVMPLEITEAPTTRITASSPVYIPSAFHASTVASTTKEYTTTKAVSTSGGSVTTNVNSTTANVTSTKPTLTTVANATEKDTTTRVFISTRKDPATKNVNSATANVPSTTPPMTVANATTKEDIPTNVIMAIKSLGARAQATNHIYVILLMIMMNAVPIASC